MFIRERIAVTEEGVVDEKAITPETDVIYIRAKMDFGTRHRLGVEMVQIIGGFSQNMSLSAYKLALVKHNITGWGGPSFKGIPCTPENIERLDMDEPLVLLVMEEIARRNPIGGESEKKAMPSTNGTGSDTRGGSTEETGAILEITPSTSPSRSATAGRKAR